MYGDQMSVGEAGFGTVASFVPIGFLAKGGFRMASVAVRSALASRIGKKGFTNVGYQFHKHSGRVGGALWGSKIPAGIVLNPATYNKYGYSTFKEIWRAPGPFQTVNGFLEKRLNDGRGIRLQKNYEFKGFID